VRAIAEEIEVRYPDHKQTSDDEIARRALSILRWDVFVPDEAIKLTVHKGLVTLAGEVQRYFQKRAAELRFASSAVSREWSTTSQ
jgi:hypothetical protein